MMKNHFILSYGWGGVGYVQGASLKSNADLWFFRFFLTPRSSGFLAALLWLGSWSNFRNRRDFPATCAYSFCVINLPKNIRSIVVLTGAGISAESGITTFRAEDGLWCNHRIEDVATPEGFERDPVLVQQFYNQRRAQLTSVAPNAAHYALAQLAEAFKGSFLLVTQNVDDLHDRAFLEHRPSERFNFYHMHGELKKMRCEESGIIYDCMDDIKTETLCGCCQEAGTLRPHIVWFGEMPLHMPQISHALGHCDLFLSIGTSGNVYPAAGFVAEARHAGAYTVELNLEPSQVHSLFDATRHGKATALVPEFVQILLRE